MFSSFHYSYGNIPNISFQVSSHKSLPFILFIIAFYSLEAPKLLSHFPIDGNFHCFQVFTFTDKVVINSFVKLLKQRYYRICVEHEYKSLNDNTQLFIQKDQKLMTRKFKSLEVHALDDVAVFHTSLGLGYS